MAFRITVDTKGLDNLGKKAVSPKARKSIMYYVGIGVVRAIKHRVSKGKDLRGKQFRPYTPEYSKYKKLVGRTGKRGQDNQGWLYLTGSMMGALNVMKYDDKRFVVGFSGMHTGQRPSVPGSKRRGAGKRMASIGKLSNALIAYHVQRLRKFVGVTEKEKRTIVRDAIRFVKSRKLI